MSGYYLDASALVKRYTDEIGSDWVRQITDPGVGNTIFLAEITLTENSKRWFPGYFKALRQQPEHLLPDECRMSWMIMKVSIAPYAASRFRHQLAGVLCFQNSDDGGESRDTFTRRPRSQATGRASCWPCSSCCHRTARRSSSGHKKRDQNSRTYLLSPRARLSSTEMMVIVGMAGPPG